MKIIRKDDHGIPILQGSDAWHALRIGMVTASMFYDIVTRQQKDERKPLEGYHKAVKSMVLELVSGTPDKSFPNKYMKDGIEREPFARMYMQETFGYVIEEVAFVKHDYLKVGVSPDGMVVGQSRNIEIKCPKDTTHMEYLTLDTVPDIYKPQVQGQMWITGAEVCDFCSYHPGFPPGMDIHIIEVPRDDVYIARLEAAVKHFIDDCSVAVKAIQARAIHNQLLREMRASNGGILIPSTNLVEDPVY